MLCILQLASPWISILGACARHAGCTTWLQFTDIDPRHSAPRFFAFLYLMLPFVLTSSYFLFLALRSLLLLILHD